MIEDEQQPDIKEGSLKHYKNFRSDYVLSRNIDVWLPENYNPQSSYAVIYMHDGQNIFNTGNTNIKISWNVEKTLSELIIHKEIQECIVVGIWNTEKRFQEYTPMKPFLNNLLSSQLPLAKEVMNSSVSDEYLKFITLELKPFIDETFSTLTDRDHTIITGSSMGGLISIYAICEFPEIFGGAACLSTHWPFSLIQFNPLMFSAITDYLKINLPSPQTHKIYFDHGTETLDSLYPQYQSEVDKIMISKGYTEKSWITRIFTGDEHSELYWQKRFHIPIKFLLSI